jgi:hypothetical protein
MAAGSHESALGSRRVAIPHGVAREGVLVRELRLRSVAGEDHAFLLDTAGSTTPNERANALLERCLDEDDPATLVASLVAGDREALLLQLRRLTLGETLDSVLTCADCDEPMELELRVGDLLVDAYEAPRSSYEVAIDAADPPLMVRFRLPTVGDVREAARSGNGDPDATRAQLLARCVSEAEGGAIDDAGAEARAAIEVAMAECDPQAEIELDLTCPSCATPFSIVFDTESFLLQELDARASALFEEVHALAFHYHWSEREILAMASSRRERYIALLADALRTTDAAGFAAT